jgi:hypothetical protein
MKHHVGLKLNEEEKLSASSLSRMEVARIFGGPIYLPPEVQFYLVDKAHKGNPLCIDKNAVYISAPNFNVEPVKQYLRLFLQSYIIPVLQNRAKTIWWDDENQWYAIPLQGDDSSTTTTAQTTQVSLMAHSKYRHLKVFANDIINSSSKLALLVHAWEGLKKLFKIITDRQQEYHDPNTYGHSRKGCGVCGVLENNTSVYMMKGHNEKCECSCCNNNQSMIIPHAGAIRAYIVHGVRDWVANASIPIIECTTPGTAGGYDTFSKAVEMSLMDGTEVRTKEDVMNIMLHMVTHVCIFMHSSNHVVFRPHDNTFNIILQYLTTEAKEMGLVKQTPGIPYHISCQHEDTWSNVEEPPSARLRAQAAMHDPDDDDDTINDKMRRLTTVADFYTVKPFYTGPPRAVCYDYLEPISRRFGLGSLKGVNHEKMCDALGKPWASIYDMLDAYESTRSSDAFHDWFKQLPGDSDLITDAHAHQFEAWYNTSCEGVIAREFRPKVAFDRHSGQLCDLPTIPLDVDHNQAKDEFNRCLGRDVQNAYDLAIAARILGPRFVTILNGSRCRFGNAEVIYSYLTHLQFELSQSTN